MTNDPSCTLQQGTREMGELSLHQRHVFEPHGTLRQNMLSADLLSENTDYKQRERGTQILFL